ncbi:MAG: hypothetical protein EXQ56_05835 [Acidobacteria bacterium]|nr:hypothetical protein [Acidobacteriota bacterium]
MTHPVSFYALILVLLSALAALPGFAQSSGGRAINRPGGVSSDPNAKPPGDDAPATTPAATPVPAPNFPNRLGDNVGWRIQPSPGVLPGARGVNHPGQPGQPGQAGQAGQPGIMPGKQPLPLTPQPSPASPADPRMAPFGGYRDVNNPGGATGPFPGWSSSDGPGIVPWDPDGGRNGPRGGASRDQRHWPPNGYAPTYYLLPYYVPYVINTQGTEGQTPSVGNPNQPAQQTGLAAQPLPQPGPYGSVSSSTGASTQSSTANLTLLVFKDRTIVLVKSYWLEGETVWYETTDGLRTPISISQLDLTLTQQLNKERNVKFVLESR